MSVWPRRAAGLSAAPVADHDDRFLNVDLCLGKRRYGVVDIRTAVVIFVAT